MRLRHLVLAGALSTVTAVSGCAAPDATGPASAPTAGGGASSAPAVTLTKDDAIAAMLPDTIKSAGVVRVASGVSFPPMEFFDTDNKTVIGFDADLGADLGRVLGVKFEFQNTNFDGIIGGLNAGRYDLALTSMIDKKERQATVDFVDYLQSGVTFMVAKGNPKGVKDKLDLCGKTAAVEKSATGDLSVDDITKECTAAGKPAVTKQPFPDQASAVQALQSGRADAVVALDLTLAYNVKTAPEAFQVDAKPFGTLPVGLPVPKNNPKLRDAVQAALKKVIDSGAYDALLTKWNLQDQALKGAPINTGQ
ncbi:arginine ABC transporter substrate-binding protein [Actinoplanes sp. ATCC 53533]|uniref:ABC transporter substrate-binding protein n=1 Tax=Actinoplanes sp. ATCC 53533 TaxID=1288362 RepID=UPI000F7B1D33|nr:ABC transporter substrate-binding protein [Actinoplanes sp. ATCC 53533]RSM59607.1 arginine ABC transporter substrate-binding protein [Actinoplanes sp. ATCC 53533]